jgi:hypothetical protein
LKFLTLRRTTEESWVFQLTADDFLLTDDGVHIGVAPHVSVPADEALKAAYDMACKISSRRGTIRFEGSGASTGISRARIFALAQDGSSGHAREFAVQR